MATNAPKAEIKVNPPPLFEGDRTKAERFLQACKLYLELNRHIYNTDHLKINYVLSFLTGGSAQAFATSLTNEYFNASPNNFGTYDDFLTKFTKTFISADKKANALTTLQTIRQGNRSAEAYVSDFQVAASNSGITQYEALRVFFELGLHPELLRKISAMNPMPDEIDEWYDAAIKLDDQYHRLKMIQGANRQRNPPPTNQSWRNNSTKPTIRALALAKLTPEEREKCFKEGRCFRCREKGHNSTNCPQKTNSFTNHPSPSTSCGRGTFRGSYRGGNPFPSRTNYQARALNQDTTNETRTPTNETTPNQTEQPTNNNEPDIKDHAKTIRAILSQLNQEEMETLYEELDGPGF